MTFVVAAGTLYHGKCPDGSATVPAEAGHAL